MVQTYLILHFTAHISALALIHCTFGTFRAGNCCLSILLNVVDITLTRFVVIGFEQNHTNSHFFQDLGTKSIDCKYRFTGVRHYLVLG